MVGSKEIRDSNCIESLGITFLNLDFKKVPQESS